MTQSLDLWYWPSIPGRGEFVRLTLEAAGIRYRDRARDVGEKGLMTDLKTREPAPFAPPYLIAPGGEPVWQVANILSWLTERYELARPEHRRLLDGYQLTISDCVAEVHNTHHPVGVSAYYEDQRPEAARNAAQFRDERIPKFLGFFEKVLAENADARCRTSFVSRIRSRSCPAFVAISPAIGGSRSTRTASSATIPNSTPNEDADVSNRRSVLRDEGQSGATVGYAELFFDLVYVFAITQLSHYLLKHDDLPGLLQTIVLFGAVWWAWTYMTWATNWLDPDRFWVRVMIFTMMLAGLAMGASIPKAFGDGGLIFALAYAGSQLARTAFVIFALRRDRPETATSMTRALLWFAATLPLWVAGGLAEPATRLILWGAAIAIELAAPMARFYVPGMGRSDTKDYGVSGHHMAERCGLFIIVALGESILVTGATVAGKTLDPATLAAFLVAFLGSIAMWWIYFDRGADKGSEHISHADDSGRIARGAYSYLHLPIVAGIIVAAVADELVLAHPTGHLQPEFVAAALGGPALFLAGCMAFKREFTGFLPLSHLAGLAAFALLGLSAILFHPWPLLLGGLGVLVLFGVAVWEWRSFHGGWTSPAKPAAAAKPRRKPATRKAKA